MAETKKAQYSKPSSQLDLEARLENGNESDRVVSTSDSYKPAEESGADAHDYRVEGNKIDEYVGTDTIYATYANETEAPLVTDEDTAEKQVFQKFADGLNPTVPEGWSASETEEEVTAEPADSADAETPDGAPVPQSATTASTGKPKK